jgi:hypothetical protein
MTTTPSPWHTLGTSASNPVAFLYDQYIGKSYTIQTTFWGVRLCGRHKKRLPFSSPFSFWFIPHLLFPKQSETVAVCQNNQKQNDRNDDQGVVASSFASLAVTAESEAHMLTSNRYRYTI